MQTKPTQKVKWRIEDLGIIKSYSIQFNQTLMGNGLDIYMMLKIFDGKLKQILSELSTYLEAHEVYRIIGGQISIYG